MLFYFHIRVPPVVVLILHQGILFLYGYFSWHGSWADGTFNLRRYLAACVSALPFTVEYAVSNVVFLLLLTAPIGEKLERIKRKYGLFQPVLSQGSG